MAEPSDSIAGAARPRPVLERAAAILGEIACAAGSAAVSLAEQQKAQQGGTAAWGHTATCCNLASVQAGLTQRRSCPRRGRWCPHVFR